MQQHAFRIVNVFTKDGDRLSGNPLCVFEDARGLQDAQMQGLARQMNLSETTFILPSDKADARIRIFTPDVEMPFAGHPTLGSGFVIAERMAFHALDGDELTVTVEVTSGIVPVTRLGSLWTLRAAYPPRVFPVEATHEELGRMVGLPADALCDTPLWVDTGVEQLIIPIATSARVEAAVPDPTLLHRVGARRRAQSESVRRQGGEPPRAEESTVYLWARDRSPWTARCFFSAGGTVQEDPATGSACANLGGWLLAKHTRVPFSATVQQGDAIGRPSRLGLFLDAQRQIYVSGEVIELGRGSIRL